MRFVWAVAAFVLAAVMIGAGIAQRTVFQGPKTQTTSISIEDEAPYVLIEGDVLTSMPGAQTLRASGEGQIFAAYGRTADLEAWLSDSTYNVVTVDKNGTASATIVEPGDDAASRRRRDVHSRCRDSDPLGNACGSRARAQSRRVRPVARGVHPGRPPDRARCSFPTR